MRIKKAFELSARFVQTVKKPGRHSDGGGLYLNVTGKGGKSWLFMYNWEGRRIELGLGSAEHISLADARDKAHGLREKVAAGINPKAEREAAKNPADAAPVIPTFGKMADLFIEGKEGGWKNDKHRDQWRMTLSRPVKRKQKKAHPGYCKSLIDIPVDEVSTEDILAVLKPIWLKRPETARRVRGRIEAVLNAAKALRHRTGENPALWRGHLDNLLPKSEKLSRGHHSAMPYKEVPAFYQKMVANPSNSNLALCFTILTAARSGETRGAVWSEIDREQRLWTIPAERMKAGREQTVPLTDGAIAILDTMEKQRGQGGYIFPGARNGALSVMALTMAMRRADAGDFTPHGFRSSFRDWAGDETSFQRDDIEACLAHVVRDQTERAYRRGNALEKRREIMRTWADYLTGKKADSVIRPEFGQRG